MSDTPTDTTLPTHEGTACSGRTGAEGNCHVSNTTARASKAGALIDELERLEFSEAFDDLAIRRLSRQARALMPHDAMGAHTVLGGISGIEGNEDEVREHYRIALELSGRSPTVLANYATALGRAGELDETFPTIMEATSACARRCRSAETRHIRRDPKGGGSAKASASTKHGKRFNRLSPLSTSL